MPSLPEIFYLDPIGAGLQHGVAFAVAFFVVFFATFFVVVFFAVVFFAVVFFAGDFFVVFDPAFVAILMPSLRFIYSP